MDAKNEPRSPFFTVVCEKCGSRMFFRAEQEGEIVPCEMCGASTIVTPPVAERPPPKRPAPPVGAYALDAGRADLGPEGFVAVVCPLCGTRMHASLAQVGELIACPDCETTSVVPQPPPRRAAPQPAPVEDIPLVDEPLAPRPLSTRLYEPPPPDARYYWIECPECQKRLRPHTGQVGRRMPCPGCGEEVIVPPPPQQEEEDDDDVFRVADVEEPPARAPVVAEPAVKETGAEAGGGWSAAEPLGVDLFPKRQSRIEDPSLDALLDPGRRLTEAAPAYELPPEPPRWTFFSHVWEFPWRGGAGLRWLVLSLALFFALGLVAMAISLYPGMGTDVGGRGIAILFVVVMTAAIMVGGFTFAYGSSCLLPIVEETANGADDVSGWHDLDFAEWVSAMFYVGFLMFASGAAGYGLGLVISLAWPPALVPAIVLSIYCTFPVLLLSAITEDRVSFPLSAMVLKSLATHLWAWLMLYVLSGGLLLVVGGLVVASMAYSPWLGGLITAPLLAAAVFIYARLLGRLLWRIGQSQPKPEKVARQLGPTP